jgi:hypothetical protein
MNPDDTLLLLNKINKKPLPWSRLLYWVPIQQARVKVEPPEHRLYPWLCPEFF